MKLPAESLLTTAGVLLLAASQLVMAYDYGSGYGSAAAKPASAVVPPAIKLSGNVLTDKNGMTLYFFDKDGAGRSACNGDCANAWPPLAAGDAASDTGDYQVIARDDGAKQWAYKGRPLYRWAGDKRAGEATGEGVGGLWRSARP